MSPGDIVAAYIVGVILILGLFIAGVVFVTAGDDGKPHRPHWPARYPYAEPQDKAPRRPRRGLVGDDEWDTTCRRAGWEPSEDERTRT